MFLYYHFFYVSVGKSYWLDGMMTDCLRAKRDGSGRKNVLSIAQVGCLETNHQCDPDSLCFCSIGCFSTLCFCLLVCFFCFLMRTKTIYVSSSTKLYNSGRLLPGTIKITNTFIAHSSNILKNPSTLPKCLPNLFIPKTLWTLPLKILT